MANIDTAEEEGEAGTSGDGSPGPLLPSGAEQDLAGFRIELAAAPPESSTLLWTWSYDAPGIAAEGTLTTTGTADADGFYLVTGITGTRNGESIIGLQPVGTAIPGNEPFAVDNLIAAEGPQLTGNGFGYALADGTYANPFFADFLSPPSYLEFFSAPPFGNGIGPEDSEGPVDFTAEPPGSEPAPVDWNALAAEVTANFLATGQWFLGQAVPPAPVDWDAVAAEVTANFAATGQWFA
jgi:hypothetical protein